MDILFNIFKATMLVAGILFFLALIVGIVTAPLNKHKEEAKKEKFIEELKQLAKDLDDLEKENKDTEK